MRKILFFYGRGCPDCARCAPWVDRLEAEEDMAFERLEVWNNQANEARKQEYADLFTKAYGRATIVPAFVDTNRRRVLCDPKTLDALKDWLSS